MSPILPRLLACAALAFSCVAATQLSVGDSSLNEAVLSIPKKSGLFTFELETTLYKPDGGGPFRSEERRVGKKSTILPRLLDCVALAFSCVAAAQLSLGDCTLG